METEEEELNQLRQLNKALRENADLLSASTRFSFPPKNLLKKSNKKRR